MRKPGLPAGRVELLVRVLLAVLFPGFGSGEVAVTCAPTVTLVVLTCRVTAIVMRADCPAAKVPTVQPMSPLLPIAGGLLLPWLTTTFEKVVLSGMPTVAFTP